MNAKTLSRASQSQTRRATSRRVFGPHAAGLGLLAGLWSACNALDAPGPQGSVVIIPTDTRQPLLADAPPAPISGGTLAISADGTTAVAADPDRDRVSVIELDTAAVRHVPLSQGDEPGRVALDDAGRAYVVLRRSGGLAVIDLAGAKLERRMHVCAAARGVAVDPAEQLVHVACGEGRLVSLRLPLQPPLPSQVDASQPEAGLDVARDVQVAVDLRDVLVHGDQLWVSTFKRAELMQVGANGQILQRVAADAFEQPAARALPSVGASSVPRVLPQVSMQPHLAYRSLFDSAGGMVMLHQAASTGEVAIDPGAQSSGATPYGSRGGCSGIVTAALTTVDAAGRAKTFPVMSGVLSVDVALAPDTNMLGIVQAGSREAGAPERRTIIDSHGAGAPPSVATATALQAVPAGVDLADGTFTQVTLVDTGSPDAACAAAMNIAVPGQSTSIVFRPQHVSADGQIAEPGWVVQSREPALLTVLPLQGFGGGHSATVIDLGGQSVRDTGHDIFHRDAGSGIACASCHPEGAEDGHVWHFNTVGARRTQALHVGLEGTAPFHWSGDQSDMAHLMRDVFVGRMGGVHQSEERLSALQRWVFALQPPAAPSSADPAAVERGHALFVSAAVGCSTCHNGDKLTNNETVDVGTGAELQVPSLRGVAYRAPFMHDGCAQTLRDRFSAACGGAAHGHTRQLSGDAIDDLVAYLRTL